MTAFRKITLTALGLGALAACTPNIPAGRATLGSDPALGGGIFTSPGGITLAVDAREIGGRTGICGVWAESANLSPKTRRSVPKILDGGAVTMDGELVAQGLGDLRQTDPAHSYAGLPANCVTTDRAWRAGDETRELKVHLVRQVVENDLDGEFGDGGGGGVIVFRPGGPGAHPDARKPWYQLSGTSISGSLSGD